MLLYSNILWGKVETAILSGGNLITIYDSIETLYQQTMGLATHHIEWSPDQTHSLYLPKNSLFQ